MRHEKVVDDLPHPFSVAHQMNTQENKISWNSYLSFTIDGYRFLYIVLTLQGYIWYEPTIILGLCFPTLPLGRIPRSTHASLKLLKTQWEKYGERVHSVARCIALVASLKTIMRNFWKTHLWEKEYNNCLQDIL
jgi:hypothetical protein